MQEKQEPSAARSGFFDDGIHFFDDQIHFFDDDIRIFDDDIHFFDDVIHVVAGAGKVEMMLEIFLRNRYRVFFFTGTP